MQEIKTLFIGTSFEGIPILEELIASPKYHINSIITQPDKPTGRNQICKACDIKKFAQKKDLQIFTPEKDKSRYLDIIHQEKPELIITISYGEIIPQEVLTYPKHKCLNVHYSLLPQFRGAVPVQMAILQGAKKTGVTIQIMKPKLDTGPILGRATVSIAPDETTPSLKKKLIPEGKKLLFEILPLWINSEITPKPQEPIKKELYCCQKDISKDKALIKWEEMQPQYIERMIRAFLPWPVAWTYLPTGKRLKIFEAELVPRSSLNTQTKTNAPGQIIKEKNRIYFTTKKPNLLLQLIEVQKEGKKKMPAEAFAAGWRGKNS
jgi:methionyl-tRNA formyltransferase